MPVTHRAAPEVRTIAEKLIRDHHRHLRNVRMEYLFRSEASRSNGKLHLGKARKLTGLNALLATPEIASDPESSSEGLEFFVIEIAFDIWDTMLSADQRVALVDHELTHCNIDFDDDNNAILSVRPHDLEEFASIVARHGLWRPDIAQFMYGIGAERLSLWAQEAPEIDVERPLHLIANGPTAELNAAAAAVPDPR